MAIRRLFALLAVLALVVAACGGDDAEDTTTTAAAAPETTEAPPETTEAPAETTTTEAMVEVGTDENPIRVLFVPSVSADEIIAGGDLLKQTLEEATGLVFEVDVPASYAATIEEMCASPDNTMGFIPAQAYVLANDLCGVEIEAKSQRFGYDVYWAQFIAARDSDINTLEDAAGKSWAYPDAGSTSGFLVPSGNFAQLGIETGDTIEAGGHSAVVRAVYNGEAEIGTTFFSPATDGEGNPVWDETPEGADVPEELIDSCGLDDEGGLVCGEDYFPRDARRNIREENPDVIQNVKIFAVSDPIPNDGVAFGPDFSDEIQTAVIEAMFAFAEDDPEGFATAFDAYSWDNLSRAVDAEFDSIRAIVQELGITIDDLDG